MGVIVLGAILYKKNFPYSFYKIPKASKGLIFLVVRPWELGL